MPICRILGLGAETVDCMLLVRWQSLQHWLQLGSMLGRELLHNASDAAPDVQRGSLLHCDCTQSLQARRRPSLLALTCCVHLTAAEPDKGAAAACISSRLHQMPHINSPLGH